jgi:hypothetical protein
VFDAATEKLIDRKLEERFHRKTLGKLESNFPSLSIYDRQSEVIKAISGESF